MRLDTTHLYRRLSRKYRDGWSYLDGEEFVGTATTLDQHSETVWDEGYESFKGSYTVIVSGDAPAAFVCEAIRDTFGGSSCTHDYDCCGCWSSHVYDVKLVEPGIFEFSRSGSRNY
jgi:hypothetical protein